VACMQGCGGVMRAGAHARPFWPDGPAHYGADREAHSRQVRLATSEPVILAIDEGARPQTRSVPGRGELSFGFFFLFFRSELTRSLLVDRCPLLSPAESDLRS
jgi:hypothetical protein